VPLAEEDLARAEIAEVDQLRELLPAALEEAVGQAVTRTNDDDARRETRRNLMLGVERALVDAAFRFALDGHQHDRVASELQRQLVRRIVGDAAVAVALTVNERRARIERRKVIRGDEDVDAGRRNQHTLAIAQARERDVARQRVGGRKRVPDEAREVAAVHARVAPRRELEEEVAQIDVRHAHERLPEEAHPMLPPHRHDRRVPRPRRDSDTDARPHAESVQTLHHSDLERAARGAAGKDVGDPFRRL